MHKITRWFSLNNVGNVWLFGGNVAGIIIFLCAVSLSWPLPQEKSLGYHDITAEPLTWFFTVMSIGTPFLLIDLVWGVCIFWKKLWSTGRLWLLVTALWAFAAYIDHANH